MNSKVALVTGSTSGIGLSIALELLKNGCQLILTGSRSKENAASAIMQAQARKCGWSRSTQLMMCTYKPIGDLNRAKGIDLPYIRERNVDLLSIIYSDLSCEVESLCNEVDKLYPCGIDILVNNAGIVFVANIDEYPVDIWNKLMAINLTAPFKLIRHFLPGMKTKGWGRIINISSVQGGISSAGSAPYAASKNGIMGLTKELVLKETQPTRKFVDPVQLGRLAVFLCSYGGASMTGSVITMDGGYTAQ